MRNLTKELRIAIDGDDIDSIKRLLDEGAPMITEHFALATRMRRHDVLRLFLDRGWDINADVDSLIPSAVVYTFNDTTLLEWSLKHGADSNKCSRIRDCTPLSYAVLEGPFEAIEILLRSGGSATQGQLLHYAAMRKSMDCLRVLEFIYSQIPGADASSINKLLDEDSPTDFAMNYRAGLGTPLHYAALAGSLDSVKFLVEKGGDPWLLDPYRRTALSWAVYNKQKEVVQFLESLRDSTLSNTQKQEPHSIGIVV
ncbi:ankyrin repeat-containing domain protein [Aspergillus avenaceus]|uniref:Ankyrin repeat-containing domain protein n=1 Tax=Aspergillus avenaceus TaxID=36643 RepID=A0A5N6TFE4_ASPAV|nr:ankyrin repeat-containing domain protein [Aspergillus avenaceus]